MSKSKQIIIFNRYKYFGGTLVLSCLCKTLRELGYDAKLFMCVDMPFNEIEAKLFRKTNIKSLIKYNGQNLIYKYFHFSPYIKNHYIPKDDITSISMSGISCLWNPYIDKENTIVIYPEVVFGNPLHAKNVVRWLMYHYPYKENTTAYSSNDLFIAYRNFFNSPSLNPRNFIVAQNYFDSNLYHQYNFGERKGNCYILRKGRKRNDLPKEFDGPIFDDNMSQKELVRIFNECKYCYSYDTQTFYTKIAAICGCISIVVMEPEKNISDYLGPNETHEGVAYGETPEQIEYAINTRDELIKQLDYTDFNRKNALHLIKILEEQFGQVKRL